MTSVRDTANDGGGRSVWPGNTYLIRLSTCYPVVNVEAYNDEKEEMI
jgi:hypothetical protein